MPATYTMNEWKSPKSEWDATYAKYSKSFVVVASEPVSENAVREYVKLSYPINNDYPEIGTGTKLKNISADDISSIKTVWEVSISWETPSGSGSLPPNPLDAPPQIRWGLDSEQLEAAVDQTGAPIQNSAGYPFANKPTYDVGYGNCTYTKNYSVSDYYDDLLPLQFKGYVVNDDTFDIDGQTIPALYARLSFEGEKTQENGIEYFRVTFKFEFREGTPGYIGDGWRERYLDRGHFDKDGYPFYSVDGQNISQPCPLDGSGQFQGLSTDDPAVLGPYVLYQEVDFDILGIS